MHVQLHSEEWIVPNFNEVKVQSIEDVWRGWCSQSIAPIV